MRNAVTPSTHSNSPADRRAVLRSVLAIGALGAIPIAAEAAVATDPLGPSRQTLNQSQNFGLSLPAGMRRTAG